MGYANPLILSSGRALRSPAARVRGLVGHGACELFLLEST